MNLILSIVLSACGVAQNRIEAKRAGSDLKTVVDKITPIAAKPNEVVNLSGRNFYDFKNLRARVETTSGSTTDVPLNITDSRNASFIMPIGAGLGVKNVTLVQGTAAIEAGKFNIIADQTDNALPIWIGDASEICTTKQYIDRNGDKQTGTKDCSAGGVAPVCEADGVVGCVTTVNFKSAATAGAASKILSGQTLAGVPGNVLLPDSVDVKKDILFGINSATTGQLDPGAGVPASCSSENQTNCVATTNFPAVDRTRILNNTSKILSDFSVVGVSGTLSTCAADGSNCFIPTYSVMSQPLKAINYNSIDAAKMLSSLTISDVVGSIVSRGSWDLTTAFPGVGYYTGTSNQPSGSTIATGTNIVGVSGSATLKPADCAADGGTGCVTTTDFPAADKAGAASKILSGQTVAGIPGNVTLPAEGKVLTGTQFGVSGNGSTGALTLPLATNVLAGSGTYGESGDQMTPALADRGTWNLTTSFPGAGYYAGVSNSPTAPTIASGTTITGVDGSAALRPADCSADGGVGCVVVGPSFAAAATAGAASKILSGQSVAGVSGNVTLPDVGKVLSSTQYGVSGTGSTGTLTLPLATNVLAGSGTYGESGDQMTPALADRGTWNLTNAFPGAGYYAGVSNSPTAPTIATGTTITGVAGSAALRPADCSADGGVGCVVVGPSFAAAATAGAASKILSGQSVAGVSGNVTLPGVGKVLTGTTFGVGGNGSTGTLTLPSAANVLSGSGTYGDPGALMTPALADRGTWNLTNAFPGAGYYAGVSNTPTAPTIASGTTIIGVAGSATLAPANCSSNGQRDCVATGTYFAGTACSANDSGCYLPTYALTTQPLKAIDYDTINSNSGNIRTSTTLGGVTGTLADCAANAATGCVTTATYKSADLTNLSAGNIKSGVTIAGTTGQYPNATYPLAGSNGADLTSATFNAQIKSSATFQYFASDGTRNTGTGDTDIAAGNIASGVDIFGTTGTYQGVAPDPWNVRIGTTINGVAGRLKVNCRNRVRSAVFNYDNPGTFAIGTGGVTSGTAIDIWDTIDDYNDNVAGLPTSIVTAWGNNTDCGGVEATAGDANVWKDVTTTSGGAASNCTTDAARCTMQDKITGLWWSKLQTATTWNTAWSNCLNLNYNGQTDWRLPTQKELMEAYTHSIRSAARTNWMTEANMHDYFWSGTTISHNGNAWYVFPTNGTSYSAQGKGTTNAVVCVR